MGGCAPVFWVGVFYLVCGGGVCLGLGFGLGLFCCSSCLISFWSWAISLSSCLICCSVCLICCSVVGFGVIIGFPSLCSA